MAERKPSSQPTKWALAMQVFLLRRRLMGPMNTQLMVITPTGRKSGKKYSVPIGFLRDGDSILTFNVGGGSNWYKNVLANPLVTLEAEGQKFQARGTPITDPAELHTVMALYQRHRSNMLPRFFGVPANASAEELDKVPERIRFIRFRAV